MSVHFMRRQLKKVQSPLFCFYKVYFKSNEIKCSKILLATFKEPSPLLSSSSYSAPCSKYILRIKTIKKHFYSCTLCFVAK